jgi:hypothetical protein
MTAVHQSVELGLGTGVIGQAQIGLPGSIAASVLMDASWIGFSLTRRRPDRALAYGAGVAVGVPIIHFTLWPWTIRRGAPVLTEAEGLPRSAMGVYNAILYLWGVAGVLAALRDTPRRYRWWSLAGLASVVGFRPVAKRHFDWIAGEAERNPAWWNRAWLPST